MAGPRCVRAEFHLRRIEDCENSTEKRVNWLDSRRPARVNWLRSWGPLARWRSTGRDTAYHDPGPSGQLVDIVIATTKSITRSTGPLSGRSRCGRSTGPGSSVGTTTEDSASPPTGQLVQEPRRDLGQLGQAYRSTGSPRSSAAASRTTGRHHATEVNWPLPRKGSTG
jgi:hypothetical protein